MKGVDQQLQQIVKGYEQLEEQLEAQIAEEEQVSSHESRVDSRHERVFFESSGSATLRDRTLRAEASAARKAASLGTESEARTDAAVFVTRTRVSFGRRCERRRRAAS